MLAYLIQMIICSVLLYLYYYLFLRNKKLHTFNRFYLLVAVVLSFLLPLVKFDFVNNATGSEAVTQLVNIFYISTAGNDVFVTSGKHTLLNTQLIACCISILITIVLLIKFLRSVVHIFNLKKIYPFQRKDRIDIVYTDITEAPFSFLNNLFWRQDLEMESETEKQILRHEMTHIQQKHSLDRIFLQIVKAVCWFNPVFYLIEKEVVILHEYIADEEAIENKDGRAFAAMLLRSKTKNFSYSPGQAIFYSSIKKRLHMLTNNKKTTYSFARRLLILPVLGSIAFVYSCQNADNTEDKDTLAIQTESVIDTATVNNNIQPNTLNTADAEVSVPDIESRYPGNWENFVRRNINQDVPVDNGAPPGTFRVTVRFSVDAEGNVSNVEAINNPGYGTAEEAVRAIKASGKWLPAEKDGQKVASKKKQSIIFQVQE